MAKDKATPPQQTWSERMATILPCGHTVAQHLYADAGELTLVKNELCKEWDDEAPKEP